MPRRAPALGVCASTTSAFPICVARARSSMRASSLVTSAVGTSRSGGAPGNSSAWETPRAAPARRLRIKGGFAVVGRQQRRLHDRAHTLGFADLHSYLVARCQQDASLSQLAGDCQGPAGPARAAPDQADRTL